MEDSRQNSSLKRKVFSSVENFICEDCGWFTDYQKAWLTHCKAHAAEHRFYSTCSLEFSTVDEYLVHLSFDLHSSSVKKARAQQQIPSITLSSSLQDSPVRTNESIVSPS